MIRVLIAAALVLACVGGGYEWGASRTESAWQARQAAADKAAADALQKANARANEAAGDYLRQHLEQEDRYASLQAAHDDLLRNHPLVRPRVVVRPAVCPGSAPPHQPHPPHPPVAPASEAGPPAPPDPVGADLDLTLAAVRLWNSALAGADTPAGACGAADPAQAAEAACAQSAGLTLRDAWANHLANAKSCAEDRHRYQALIDFLREE